MTTQHTTIEWTDRTWNPVTGCTKVSPGCDNCYAENIAHRFAGTAAFPNGFDVTQHEARITQPLRWKKPARVFVNSMSDLFHADVPDDFIARVFAVMALTPQHTYQVLTKRHSRMRSLLSYRSFLATVDDHREQLRPGCGDFTWPLPNVWLGVSVENQKWADIRIPALLGTPAAVRFLSCEPLLGPIDLFAGDHSTHERDFDGNDDYICLDCSTDERHVPWRVIDRSNLGIDWVIVGGESGRGARPMHPDWARGLRDQCATAGVPFFFKQWGEYLSATIVDDTEFAGGRAYNHPLHGGRSSATLRTRGSSGTFRGADTRLMRPGDRTRNAWLLDKDTIAVRVGKKAAGRELDGRLHDAFPSPAGVEGRS